MTQKSLIDLTKTDFLYTGELNLYEAFESLNIACDTRQSDGNAVVSFVVNKVDYDPTNFADECDDVHRQFALGNYGCFVDSLRTRIVQLGVQNKGLPNIYRIHRFREEYGMCSVARS